MRVCGQEGTNRKSKGWRKEKGWEKLPKDMTISGHRKNRQAARGPEMGRWIRRRPSQHKREERQGRQEEHRKDRRGEEGGGRQQQPEERPDTPFFLPAPSKISAPLSLWIFPRVSIHLLLLHHEPPPWVSAPPMLFTFLCESIPMSWSLSPTLHHCPSFSGSVTLSELLSPLSGSLAPSLWAHPPSLRMSALVSTLSLDWISLDFLRAKTWM